MLDFEGMLRRALAHAEGGKVALATPYDLPDRIARDLMGDTPLRALVADSSEAARADPTCAGWWVDRTRGRIFLRRGVADTVLLAGLDVRQTAGAHLLLEARLKGYKTIISCDGNGALIENVDVVEALEQRLDAGPRFACVGELAFEDAYQIIHESIGDALRLKPWEFNQRKVVLTLGSLGPGGAERQAAMTAVGVQRSGRYEAEMLCSFVEKPADFFKSFVESSGAKVVKLAPAPEELTLPIVQEVYRTLDERFSSLRMGDVFLEIVRYAAALRQLKPGILHTWMDYSNSLCGTAAQLVGVPGLVMGGRSVSPAHFRIFQPYMRAGYQAILKRHDAVMLNNSRAGAENYVTWLGLPQGSIHVIHNGFDFPEIDREASRGKVREAHGFSQEHKVVGSILRFAEEKQPGMLMDMATEVHRQDANTRFLFCGGGPMLEDMRNLSIERGLQDVIKFPGIVEDSWSALAAMDLFVLTSRMEGLPNVLIEAQATGLPVVCTGVGGMCETFAPGVTGLAVKGATALTLANAVTELLTAEDRLRDMSVKACARAREAFGIDRMTRETIDAYLEAAREPTLMARLRASA